MTAKGKWIVGVLGAIIAYGWLFAPDPAPDPAPAPADPYIEQHGEAPTCGEWGCPPARNVLQQTLGDPGSLAGLACEEPLQSEDGWLVWCSYRARNAFGGMVRSEQGFVVSGGMVRLHRP